MKKNIYIFILLLFCCHTLNAQDSVSKAGEVIKKAEAVTFKRKAEVKGYYLEYSGKYRSSSERKSKGYVDFTYQAKLWFEYAPNIKYNRFASYPGNQQEILEDVFSNGEFSESNKIKSGDSGYTDMSFVPNGDAQKIKEQNIAKLKYITFTSVFPMFFKFEDDLKFNYLGTAKSNDQTANVVGTNLANRYEIKMFIDTKTNLPLMLIAKYYDDILKKDIEQKFFYSDFKEENGLFFAHKIITQENNEVVEEKEIKLVTLNPQLKTNFFEVKN
jgi:hypothetical protein